MEVTLEQVATQVSEVAKSVAEFTKQLGETEQRLTAHVDKQLAVAVEELTRQAQVYKEELKEEVKKGAEGYGGTLEGIERELADLNKTVDVKFRDHDRVLADHHKRITTLEKRR